LDEASAGIPVVTAATVWAAVFAMSAIADSAEEKAPGAAMHREL
jgi:hypothetical protein